MNIPVNTSLGPTGQIEDEVGRACNTLGKRVRVGFWYENLKEMTTKKT
jgi:hypothetical protein